MLKKTVIVSLAALVLSSSAMAIDKPEDAAGFNSLSTAYPSSEFNTILEGYGLSLPADGVAGVPRTYAEVNDGKVSFNDFDRAYTPKDYHTIFTGYGLELSPEMVSKELGVTSYATVKDGEVVFGQIVKLAFNGEEWENIIGAYALASQEMPPAAVVPKDSDGDGVIDANDECPGTPQGVVVDDRGCWALSTGMLFDFDSAVIKEDFYSVLDEIKKIFTANPGLKIVVEGHADSTGPEAYNQTLSEKRANAVVDYLVKDEGVAADRLKAVGKGELSPAYSNDSEMGRAKNRRVEFTPMM